MGSAPSALCKSPSSGRCRFGLIKSYTEPVYLSLMRILGNFDFLAIFELLVKGKLKTSLALMVSWPWALQNSCVKCIFSWPPVNFYSNQSFLVTSLVFTVSELALLYLEDDSLWGKPLCVLHFLSFCFLSESVRKEQTFLGFILFSEFGMAFDLRVRGLFSQVGFGLLVLILELCVHGG